MRKAALTTIAALVDEDERVVFIGSDLGAGTMDDVRQRHPDRVLMEGIAEQHLVGFAAGLALEGFIPYVHTIATFLTRRALEQTIVDVALHRLPVRLVGAGGGMVYAPLGPTHQSIDDFALMRAIPEMIVGAPADPVEMEGMLRLLRSVRKPAYVRIAKGGEPDVTSGLADLAVGRARTVVEGDGLAVLTTGALLHQCLEAVRRLEQSGTVVTLVHLPFVAPLDVDAVRGLAASHRDLFVVEEHLPRGGLASAVADVLAEDGSPARLHRATLPDRYADRYGSQQEHWELHGLDADGVAARIRSLLFSPRKSNDADR